MYVFQPGSSPTISMEEAMLKRIAAAALAATLFAAPAFSEPVDNPQCQQADYRQFCLLPTDPGRYELTVSELLQELRPLIGSRRANLDFIVEINGWQDQGITLDDVIPADMAVRFM